MYMEIVALLVGLLLFVQGKPQALVLTTTSQPSITDGDNLNSSPTISKFHVTSNIQFRYAHTQVVSYMKNPSSAAEEISFTAVIPDSAFISNFSMVIQGKEYVAQVKAKEDAKKEYDEAVTRGRGAGLVSQDTRDANTFTVATNVEAGQKVEFKLTYEELLERNLGKYEHAINVNPGQIVEDFRIDVFINESLSIKSLNVPELKESNDLDFEENQESKIAKVRRDVDGDASKAHIIFAPDRVYQEEAGEQGLSGQFLIQYEVDRNNQDNEIQVINGYFVHYFTPEDLPTLPKHVIFVLDTSGSMLGEKIDQLKDAMFTILDDMTDRDFFNIVTFSSGVSHWNLLEEKLTSPNFKLQERRNTSQDVGVSETQFVIMATDKNKKHTIDQIIGIYASGGTNINDGLLEGLKIASFAKQNENLPEDVQSIIVFLSDGQATVGVTNGTEIKDNVKKANTLKVPIYSLGFGRAADFDLIKDISANADAYSKHIYEGSDAAIQLENFFAEISSPLLFNLKFQYVGGLVDNSSVSEPEVRTFFKGGEFVVAGKLLDLPRNDDEILDVTVTGDGRNGDQFLRKMQICLWPGHIIDIFNPNDSFANTSFDDTPPFPCTFPPPPPRSQAQNFLQNLHAFLNIKQLLKKSDEVINEIDGKSRKEKALKLSLDNNFVTELTSLLVVRPDEEPIINTLVQTEPEYNDYGGNALAYASPAYGGFLSGSGDSSGLFFDTGPFVSYESYDASPALNTTNVEIKTTTVEIKEEAATCSGNITLFSKTYLRGESVTFSEDTEDLDDFDNSLVSIEVKGNCCWTIFTEVGYQGNSQSFGQGKYKKLVQVRDVFRKGSSLRKTDCKAI